MTKQTSTASTLPQRGSGILAHITSLPSPYGIGDLGFSSYTFLEFLARAGQGYWQFLPTGPGSPIFDKSPYMSTSAFAGSPLLISPDLLFEEGLIQETSLASTPAFSEYNVDFQKDLCHHTWQSPQIPLK